MVDRSDSASAANNAEAASGLTGTKQLIRRGFFEGGHQSRVVCSGRNGDFTDDCATERGDFGCQRFDLAFIKSGVFIAGIEQGEAAPTQLLIEETRGSLSRERIGADQAVEAGEALLGQGGRGASGAEAGETGGIEKGRGGQAGAGAIGADDGDGAVLRHEGFGDGGCRLCIAGGIAIQELNDEFLSVDDQRGAVFTRQQDTALADVSFAEGGALAVGDDGQGDRFARRDDEFLRVRKRRDPKDSEQCKRQ